MLRTLQDNTALRKESVPRNVIVNQEQRLAEAKAMLEAEIIRFAREKSQLQTSQDTSSSLGIVDDPPISAGMDCPPETVQAGPKPPDANQSPAPAFLHNASLPSSDELIETYKPGPQRAGPMASPQAYFPPTARAPAAPRAHELAAFLADRGWGSEQSRETSEHPWTPSGPQARPWQDPAPELQPAARQPRPRAAAPSADARPSPPSGGQLPAGRLSEPEFSDASGSLAWAGSDGPDGPGAERPGSVREAGPWHPSAATAAPGAVPISGPGAAGGPAAAGTVVTLLTLNRTMEEVRAAP